MNIKKLKYIIVIQVLLALAFLWGCSTQETVESVHYPMEDFIYRLADGGYLAKEAVEALPDFRVDENEENGGRFYLFSALNEDDGTFLHNVQIRTDSDENLIWYHYKQYDFRYPMPDNPLTEDEALILLNSFAKEFIPEGEKLDFYQEPAYFSLYDPGHVESWVAAGDGENGYIIMVDLDMNAVIYYSSPED